MEPQTKTASHSVQTPDWVKHAVFYQIYPDRFARSARTPHPRGISFKPWGTSPVEQGFQGGDLYGVAEKLGYLQELGVTAIYLNPIFASASNHRYHTYDYLAVDPLLGGNAALRVLLDAAHARGMRVVLDGVFNHASRGFWAFHHILETGGDSPYLDWFIVNDWPLNPYPKNGDELTNYAAWWGLAALPKFNVANPGVRDYLLDVARFWIEFGADGWRLDVPEEIDDVPFWQDFRRVVKAANPDAYIVGEIWHDAADWLRGDRFDAVMNYVFSRAALGFFGAETLNTTAKPGGYPIKPLTARRFAREVERMAGLHDWQVMQAQMNLLDSHDTARVLWTVNGDVSALRLSLLLQMTFPGAPCIYYGTELGLAGGPDPGSREAFPWHDPGSWDSGLLEFVRRAVALRHAHPIFADGALRILYGDHGLFAFRRDLGSRTAVVVFNAGQQDARLDLDLVPQDLDAEEMGDDAPPPAPAAPGAAVEGPLYRAVWNGSDGSGATWRAEDNVLRQLDVPARSALVLLNDGA